ncbi:AraC family transcriptional regulator [Streptococcus oriscaviae]|uniref:AraC family transcriptional regulator n=1 Tax=Streptococcus oriscaviae TaxID=2781599 RepID=A0ABX7YNX5_9STRE|nr:AraC family transcriptional regulator [Streptococcus oriscaviae]QUE55173.1 AraC family transcriptional regulator [Streptococcus oriscaviae]
MKKHLTDQFFQHQIDYDNQLLPFKYYYTHVKQGIPDVLFHWHNEIEINYVYEGTARYHIDYDYFDSQAGDIILMRPNAMHSIHPIENEEHVTDTFVWHLDLLGASILDQTSMLYLQPLQNDGFKFVPRIQPHQEGYAPVKECLFRIFSLVQAPEPYYELSLKSQLFELLHLLYRYGYILRKNTDDLYRKNEKLRGLIDHIHHHYQDNLTIEAMADYMGYSKTHFMSVFKQHTGTSCMEFVIQVRLREACTLLTTSMKPILDISNQVGFNNLSNFNRQFKRYYKVTPSRYRKQFRKERNYVAARPHKLERKTNS